MLSEFGRLRGSVTQAEVDRAKTNLKAALVMGEESPGSRASSNATDWWLLKRVRSLHEISDAISAVSIADINEFLEQFPFAPCSIVTLGRAPLQVPSDIVR